MIQGTLVVGTVLFLGLGLFGYLGRLWVRSGGSVGPFRNGLFGGAWPLLMPRAKWLSLVGLAFLIAAVLHALLS